MGQRHQIYVISKQGDKYTALGAYHHQWCYGITAANNLTRAVGFAERALERSEYALSDSREVRSLITAMYGINEEYATISIVHDESEYLIKDGVAHPENGDNNDGCGLIILDRDNRSARGCLFAFEGLEGGDSENWTPYTPREYAQIYHPGVDLDESILIITEINPVTQGEFDAVFNR